MSQADEFLRLLNQAIPESGNLVRTTCALKTAERKLAVSRPHAVHGVDSDVYVHAITAYIAAKSALEETQRAYDAARAAEKKPD